MENKQSQTSVSNILKDLIKIPSYIDVEHSDINENRVVDYIEQWIKDNTEHIVERQRLPGNRYNLIIKSGEPNTIFLAHTDTVPPTNKARFNQFQATELDGEIWGRGATDMKSGIASLLMTLLMPESAQKNFWMVFYADEEYNFLGMKEFLKKYSSISPQLIVSADGSDLNFGLGCRGLIELNFRIRGKLGHPGKGSGKSATRGMIDCLGSLEKLLLNYSHPILGNSLLNIAYIHGGAEIENSYDKRQLVKVGRQGNVVPNICEAVIEIRPSISDLSANTIKEHLEKICQEKELEIDLLETVHDLGSMYTDPKDVRLFQELANKDEKVVFADLSKVGYLDMQMAWKTFGKLPAIMFGSGFGETNHGADERISIDYLNRGTKIFEKIMSLIE